MTASAPVPLHEVDPSLSDADFAALARMVQKHLGIRMPDDKRSLVVQRMRAPLARAGCRTFREWAGRNMDHGLTPEVLSVLADALTTNHTAFWREPAHFEHLRDKTLPELVRNRSRNKDVRLWCAASATGEEPWQLAMLLRDGLPADWQGGLLATDVSAKALNAARDGRYDAGRLSSLPENWRKKWIEPLPDGGGRIRAELRADITFRRLNLLHGPWAFKKPFDVIFCRNVLIYFEPPVRDSVVTHLVQSLAPGGTLYVGHSESLPNKFGLRQLGTSTWMKPGGPS